MSKFTDKIDMRFQYVPAAATDISKTIKREQKRLAELAEAEKAKPRAKVLTIGKENKK